MNAEHMAVMSREIETNHSTPPALTPGKPKRPSISACLSRSGRVLRSVNDALPGVFDGISQQIPRFLRHSAAHDVPFTGAKSSISSGRCVHVHELERAVAPQDLDAIRAAVEHAQEERARIEGKSRPGIRIDRGFRRAATGAGRAESQNACRRGRGLGW